MMRLQVSASDDAVIGKDKSSHDQAQQQNYSKNEASFIFWKHIFAFIF